MFGGLTPRQALEDPTRRIIGHADGARYRLSMSKVETMQSHGDAVGLEIEAEPADLVAATARTLGSPAWLSRHPRLSSLLGASISIRRRSRVAEVTSNPLLDTAAS
ncbi:MAG: hypothetical protein EA388_00505 [Nitriliruptor sp.]|nr:MAG: hypothetical protein EA388_00505 [Nitriliruptor sp.]